MNRVAALAVAIVVLLTANLALAAKDLRALVLPTWDDDRILTILIIGSDAGLPRPGDPRTGRADGLHVLAVDTKELRATIVDIPRDSYISGSKVNGFLSFGGPDRLVSVLSGYTGIKFDYYALTNFRGMKDMTRGMGGITTTLDTAINDSASQANLKAGEQRLNGYEALAYTRARKTVAGGDFGRTAHQGQLLQSVHRDLRARHADLPSLTKMISVFSQNTVTDIPSSQMFRLGALALRLKPKHVKRVSLSGPTGFVGPESVVFLQQGSAFSDIRAGRIGR